MVVCVSIVSCVLVCVSCICVLCASRVGGCVLEEARSNVTMCVCVVSCVFDNVIKIKI